MAKISLRELQLFHSIDREIFTRLIFNLSRNMSDSLLMMALWLWLRENKFPDIASRLQNLADPILDAVAKEASLCLRVLDNNYQDYQYLNTPLIFTSRIMEKEIHLNFFAQNRYTAISGVKTLLNGTCSRIFTDILQLVLQNHIDDFLAVPGFPHPTFGPMVIETRVFEYELPRDEVMWGLVDSGTIVHQDDRTMFLTFSRGFRVTPQEVTDLFSGLFGESCVESVQMKGGQNNGNQPLFALMVLHSVATIDKMLKGKTISKFKTNGKHIWARKYEPRN